ncbi:MAG TPA: hypothetical protein VFL27_11795 [Candidatus Dormibacteraeota bacterium]|nr:hypothetical protein [Candidatus Dormibacteraeota bacterium]
MTIRSEMRDALDEVVPSFGAPGLPERVVGAVLADKRRRRNKEMLFRLRAPLSLVAALMVIALVAAVLVGGRLLQDWNASGSHSARGSSSELSQLEARPLTMPYIHSVSECKTGPVDEHTLAVGAGPLFLEYSGYAMAGWTSWGDYGKVVLFTDTEITGPILVRTRDVVTKAVIVFVGRYAAGPVVGTDTLSGGVVTQHSELVLSAATSEPASDIVVQPQHKFEWQFTLGFPKFSTLSAAWQIDGLTFSETFVAC